MRLEDRKGVRLRFAGRSFDAGVSPATVTMRRKGKVVVSLQIDAPPSSGASALARAREWAGEFGLPEEALRRWGTKLGGSESKQALQQGVLTAGNDSDRVGDASGPIPTVEVLYSYRDEKPAIASIQFFWDK